ncbi:ABC transporter permease [Streptomyces prunicolor]|uniref:ABC transporter permease n=1 Tax=Streptomyces prunicolor TaxID=67348 RepID=UPI003439B737
MAGSALATQPQPQSQPAPTATPGRMSRLRRALAERRTRYGLLNAAPVVVYLLILFVYPIFSTLLLSLKGEQGGWTLHWYADAFQGADLEILLTTLRISAETSLLSLVIGFLLANAVTRLKPLWAGLVMLVVIVPHFISALVRTYGWIILLGEHGVVNNVLTDLHIPGAPFQLLYNEIGVVIGTTSVMLPYTVLLLYAVMRAVDRRLLAAAASMGAGRITIFRRVYLPLVAPGLVNAGVLCFILCLGYYLTPALMGGPKQTMVASLIDDQVMKQNQWNGASALGIILLLLTFAGLLLLRLLKSAGEAYRKRGTAS